MGMCVFVNLKKDKKNSRITEPRLIGSISRFDDEALRMMTVYSLPIFSVSEIIERVEFYSIP